MAITKKSARVVCSVISMALISLPFFSSRAFAAKMASSLGVMGFFLSILSTVMPPVAAR